MIKMSSWYNQVSGKLKRQLLHWRQSIRYEFRFLLCGFFSYLTFEIFRNIGKLSTAQINQAISSWPEPGIAVLLCYIVFLGYVGLGFSVIAAALFKSLLQISE